MLFRSRNDGYAKVSTDENGAAPVEQPEAENEHASVPLQKTAGTAGKLKSEKNAALKSAHDDLLKQREDLNQLLIKIKYLPKIYTEAKNDLAAMDKYFNGLQSHADYKALESSAKFALSTDHMQLKCLLAPSEQQVAQPKDKTQQTKLTLAKVKERLASNLKSIVDNLQKKLKGMDEELASFELLFNPDAQLSAPKLKMKR